MGNHDFGPLAAQYPGVIAQMPPVFTAHEFILRLAQQNQRLYVEALFAYKDNPTASTATPFLIVHRALAKKLSAFPLLVTHQGDVKSNDIFDNQSECSQWRRV
jgi:hypothetical protein